MMMGAFSIMEKSIRIMSPWSPDNTLLGALATAARRRTIHIVIPAQNNLAIVSHAMAAQFDQILKDGSRIFAPWGRSITPSWMTVDGHWPSSAVQSDLRSLRLNFEIDLRRRILACAAIDARIEQSLDGAERRRWRNSGSARSFSARSTVSSARLALS